MSWYAYPAYVSVAERRRKAEAAAKKIAKKTGRTLAPIIIDGKKIASTFWGKAWCENLEAYSDYENRLPRGRSYVRNGSVIDLQISAGKVQASVQGSSLYKVSISFNALSSKKWGEFKSRSSGKVTNLLDLLQGRLSQDILSEITAEGRGLFPSPSEIKLDCSCPDGAAMCKHVAAVLYGVGARLDQTPEHFFTLRGVEMQELLSAASAAVVQPLQTATQQSASLDGADLADIFGVEIEAASPAHGLMAPNPSVAKALKSDQKPAVPVKARGKTKTSMKAKPKAKSKPKPTPKAKAKSKTRK